MKIQDMSRLNRTDLEEFWQIFFNEKDFDTCLLIDNEYNLRYGAVSFKMFQKRRLFDDFYYKLTH